MRSLVNATGMSFHRYAYDDIDWNLRMFGLVGPRGVGKTTLLLQRAKELAAQIGDGWANRVLYLSVDNIYFSGKSLVEQTDEFVRDGGAHLFIDEVHKYASWSRELKQIYDTHPDLHVAFTGSSVLDIRMGEADLSRRAPIYTMQGLSFREYLALFHGIETRPLTLEEILTTSPTIDALPHPLPLFKDYLTRGYYPFATDSQFETELLQVVSQTLEVDIPQFMGINALTSRKLKKLLTIIAQSVPFKPSMEKIAKMVNISRNDLGNYFAHMERAGLISQLLNEPNGIMSLGKVEKVYLDNPNMAYALSGETANIGNIRETFFFNQMRVRNVVTSSKLSDFRIGGKTFEVGGKKKGTRQIEEAEDGYVVRDDVEQGHGRILPLWTFGMNY